MEEYEQKAHDPSCHIGGLEDEQDRYQRTDHIDILGCA